MVTQSRPIPVILTRPAAQGARFADQLSAVFGNRIAPVLSPLLETTFHTPVITPQPWAGVLFTSATGVKAAARLGPPLARHAYCVGDRTAEAAREAGYDALSASGDAEALVALILSQCIPGPLLHLRGQHSRGDVASRLNSAGTETSEAVLYCEEPRRLSPEALASLQADRPVILPLFSPRTSQILAAELNALPHHAPIYAVVMSRAVSGALGGLRLAGLFIAVKPAAQAMRDAVGEALIAAESA